MVAPQAERLTRLAAAARASRQVWQDDCEPRDAEIYRLATEEDVKVRRLAEWADLSLSHIQRIIIQQAGRAQARRRDEARP